MVPDVTTTATQGPKNDSGRHFPSNMKGIFGSQRSCWVIFLMYKFLRDNFSCVLRGGFRNGCIKSFKLDSANLNDKGKYHQASLITNCSPLKINVFFDEISLFKMVPKFRWPNRSFSRFLPPEEKSELFFTPKELLTRQTVLFWWQSQWQSSSMGQGLSKRKNIEFPRAWERDGIP